jgi:hypothetical protein
MITSPACDLAPPIVPASLFIEMGILSMDYRGSGIGDKDVISDFQLTIFFIQMQSVIVQYSERLVCRSCGVSVYPAWRRGTNTIGKNADFPLALIYSTGID